MRFCESKVLDKRLADCALRLSKLLLLRKELGDVLDLVAGALASLICAEKLEYKDREAEEELPWEYYIKLSERVKKMAAGTLPPHGRWISGYYFNSALLRIGIARDQIRHLLSSLDKKNKTIYQDQKPSLREADIDELHREYRKLKHELRGLREGRRIKFDQAVEALVELISVLEARKSVLSDPTTKFPRMESRPRFKRRSAVS